MRKNNWVLSTAVAVGICLAALSLREYFRVRRWRENTSSLSHTVETGILLQIITDDFKKRAHRYPTPQELNQIVHYLYRTFRECITSNATDYVTPIFDDSGGWYCNPTSGEVRINYNEKYFIGPDQWVDISNISFHLPTRINVNAFHGSRILDYSYLNDHLSALDSDITNIIGKWASTNLLNSQ